MDGRQARVAGADGVAPLGLEVVQEGADEPGVEIRVSRREGALPVLAVA